MQHKKITFIGGGNMAKAIILGLLKQGYPASFITVCDPNPEKLALFSQKGVLIAKNNVDAVKWADVVLLAVKPQVLADACFQISAVDFSQKLLISIAAGISSQRLGELLPTASNCVRVMPNTPALVGAGISGLYANAHLLPQWRQFATDLLSAVGEIVWVKDEQDMHTVTAASGSSPAYFFLFMEAMQQTIMEMGLSAEQARQLIQQSALGAAKMVIENPSVSLAQLRENVTSKGGTTAAALAEFNTADLPQIVNRAMQACVSRSREMESQF